MHKSTRPIQKMLCININMSGPDMFILKQEKTKSNRTQVVSGLPTGFGYDGFVYYSGEHPSQSLPSAGTVKYSGNWQYMTDAKRHRTGQAVASENLGYTHIMVIILVQLLMRLGMPTTGKNILPNIRLISTKKTWKVS